MPFQYSRFTATPATSASRSGLLPSPVASMPYGITCTRREGKPFVTMKSAIACEGATTWPSRVSADSILR